MAIIQLKVVVVVVPTLHAMKDRRKPRKYNSSTPLEQFIRTSVSTWHIHTYLVLLKRYIVPRHQLYSESLDRSTKSHRQPYG